MDNWFRITILKGLSLKKNFLFKKDIIKIGSDISNDLIINDPYVSPIHTEIRQEDGSYIIIDLSPDRTTLVNNQKIGEKILRDGDNILVGKNLFKFSSYDVHKESGLSREKKIRFVLIFLISLGIIYLLIPQEKRVKKNENNSIEHLKPAPEPSPNIDSVTIEKAEALYNLGKKKLLDWKISNENIYHAVKSFEESIEILRLLKIESPIYEKVKEDIIKAREILDEQFRIHKFRAERSIKLKNYDEAFRELNIIKEMIPETDDPMAIYARERSISIK